MNRITTHASRIGSAVKNYFQLKDYLLISFEFLIGLMLMRIFEVVIFKHCIQRPDSFRVQEAGGFVTDIQLWSFYTIIGLISFPLYKINSKVFTIFWRTLNLLMLIISACLILFFTQRGGPLDEEIFMLTFAEFMHTTMASGLITVTNSTLFTLLIAALFVIPFYVCKMLHQRRWIVHVIAGSALAGALSLTVYSLPRNTKIFAINKNYYFISESLKYLFKNDEKIDLSDDMLVAIREYQQDRGGHFYSDSLPFYRELPTGNPLGEYFDSSSKRPNVVILILESFSSQVSGSNPTMGDFFTPFFDSLAGESLYWKNCMSSSLISYEALPTLTGSLPFGKSGFNSIITYPNHLSLVSLLKNQGYNVSFITSSPMYYDNQGTYMKQQGTDYISYDFGEKYKHYERKGEWNWGYPIRAKM